MTEAAYAEIRAVLSQVLTQEDWSAIAASASDRIRHQVLNQDLVAVARRNN